MKVVKLNSMKNINVNITYAEISLKNPLTNNIINHIINNKERYTNYKNIVVLKDKIEIYYITYRDCITIAFFKMDNFYIDTENLYEFDDVEEKYKFLRKEKLKLLLNENC